MQPLNPSEYDRVKPLVENVPFNTLFAQMIISQRVKGTIYVDSAERPEAALVFHPYGMLLLCGTTDNVAFSQAVAEFMLKTAYPHTLWLQVYPPQWSQRLPSLLPGRLQKYPAHLPFDEAESLYQELNRENVVECTRVNFAFNRAGYLQSVQPSAAPGLSICRMERKMFEDMSGVVIARHFWDSYADFAGQGAGFGVVKDNTILSTCFTAFVKDDLFEVGIETGGQFRGQGYAGLAARAFIDYCLEHNRQPVWACRKENAGSYKLAQNLGFKVIHEHPYYALVKNSVE